MPWKTEKKNGRIIRIKMHLRKEAVKLKLSAVSSDFAFSGAGCWGSAIGAH